VVHEAGRKEGAQHRILKRSTAIIWIRYFLLYWVKENASFCSFTENLQKIYVLFGGGLNIFLREGSAFLFKFGGKVESDAFGRAALSYH